MCNYPATPYCRMRGAIRHTDGHAYCPHHLGIVRRDGSPYPISIRT